MPFPGFEPMPYSKAVSVTGHCTGWASTGWVKVMYEQGLDTDIMKPFHCCQLAYSGKFPVILKSMCLEDCTRWTWLPRSRDLNPLDFFFWYHLKLLVYVRPGGYSRGSLGMDPRRFS
ncbi:hypothetical protein TNCV_4603071 [Trichonephila clavipes]|nr:hypothetical protein TNCV_4603071 [Trichonephila clavipes]